MAVDAQHPQYAARCEAWKRTRTAVEGEDAVKKAGEEYLPSLSGQDSSEYEAYKTRATFYGATGRTAKALVGSIWRKPPTVEFPQPDVLKKVGRGRRSLDDFSREATQEDVAVGRVGILVDSPSKIENGDPYLALYRAENITNWREAENAQGELIPVEIELREEYETRSEEDPFQVVFKERYRVLRLGVPEVPEPDSKGIGPDPEAYWRELGLKPSELEQPFYFQEMWVRQEAKDNPAKRDEWIKDGPPIIPRARGGKLMTSIPFEVANVLKSGLSPEPDGTLDALASVNLSHWRNSADLEHGAHFTGLPTPYITGVSGDAMPTQEEAGSDSGSVKALRSPKKGLSIGSAEFLLIPSPGAQIGFLEFTGAGLASIRSLMEDKKREMASLGARLLEEPSTSGVEAAETVKLRQAGEMSVLSALAGTLSGVIERSLQRLAEWRGLSGKVSFKLNQDFGLAGVDTALLTAAMAAVQGGLWSYQVWYAFCERHELYPKDWNIKKEAALIAAGPPAGLATTALTTPPPETSPSGPPKEPAT
jgi:hypothetical protein